MEKHENRAHALLSASGAHRWLNCTPSAVLETKFPDTTSEAAKEGTLAHELCEIKLSDKKTDKAHAWIKEQPLYAKEMESYTNAYVEEIDRLKMSFDSEPFFAIESKLDLSAYIPGGFGTADAVLIGGKKLIIADFKYGKGVKVDAEKNPQMMLYALGAYEKYRILYPIEEVQMEIIQPRIDNYSSYSCSLKELLKFGEEVKEKAETAIKGKGEFKPGDWCRFCRARAKCKARADYNVQLAFAADTSPELLTDEQIGEYLKKGEDVASWLSDVKGYALKACLAGKSIPGWKAVRGRSIRAFDDADAAFQDAIKAGVEEAMLYERKPISLSALERLMGKKRFSEELGSHVVKPPGKPTLAHESDKREAVTDVVTPEEAFK